MVTEVIRRFLDLQSNGFRLERDGTHIEWPNIRSNRLPPCNYTAAAVRCSRGAIYFLPFIPLSSESRTRLNVSMDDRFRVLQFSLWVSLGEP